MTPLTATADLTIRWARPCDHGTFLDLAHQHSRRLWHHWRLSTLTRAGAQILIAYRLGTAIGYAVVLERKSVVHLVDIAVRRPSRNHGVGRALIERIAGHYLDCRDRRYIAGRCNERNMDAMAFLSRCGFVSLGLLAKARGKEMDADRFLFVRTKGEL